MKREITYSEKYDPAMKITHPAAADAYFEECVAHTMSFGGTRESAEETERCNLGYWAGYYGDDVRERVERLFHCAHPIFGKIAENGRPTVAQALDAGAAFAKQGPPPRHEPWCEGDGAHPGDCKTATRLARLTAFAEAVRDEFECSGELPEFPATIENHVGDCWHCYAERALGDL